MGQSASRQQVPATPSPAPSTITTSNSVLVTDDSVDDIPPPAAQSRRRPARSIRRSILSLVKPSSTQPEPPTANSERKSWRTSRRWSKATPALVTSEDIPVPSTSHLPSAAAAAAPTIIPEKEPEQPLSVVENDADEPTWPRPSTAETEQPQESQDIGSWFTDEDARSVDDQVVISPEHFTQDLPDVPEDVSPPPTINQPDQTTPPQSPSAPRQFPPPGTLVVVQGVVHTTDVPRQTGAEPSSDAPETPTLPTRGSSVPTRSSTPVSLNTERPGARNRLSALLRSRPSSMASAVEVIPPPQTLESPSDAESPEPVIPSADPAPVGSISSSSIDVLGTLLSVAAAATAASLLTGSSEPILSSGLTPPTQPGPGASPLMDQTIRPMSPTPTSGITDPIGGRTERMRQAWTSIRERLGIRPPRFSDRTDDRGDPADARERMLAEMARAFNLGLGINSTGPDGSPSNEPPEATSPLPQLPAEGTFERFLIDLQVDLRATLTQQQEEILEGPTPELSQAVPPTDWDPVIGPPNPAPGPPPMHDSSHEESDMPALEELSDSDTESNFSNDSLSAHHDTTTTPSSSVRTSPLQPSQDSNLPQRSNVRINWWRLYRFPPIVAPRGAGSLEVNLRTPGSPTTPTPNVPVPTAMTESTPSISPSSESPSDPSTSNPQNIVVPVIVVGLQSVNVNMDWRQQDGETEGEAPLEEEMPLPEPSEEDALPRRPDTPRGRRWHSRAASAFRNLRPGRRTENAGQPTDSDAAGSRTFLIYVIGGYYPPEHSIVTGEANNLDSFEALLDLAEILGQVKPPTASKEDIEKSNLEVIKAVRVAAYEAEGKISSNCTERCLICLDEYVEEDDVRVMTCRHAFHKGCVDTWLSTGKNNCPACRGAGVSTDESIPTH